MPKAFFATASIKGSLHTFMPHDFFFFFIEIHGVIQYIQIQHWGDVFLNGVGNACSDLPPFAALFPCCLCSCLLMSLYYSRVNSTKAGGSQPHGIFVLLNLSTPLARNKQCEAQGSPGQSHEFSCPPTNADFLEVGVLP